MRVTMHQPEHLPWLGFFHKMALADLYVIMDDFQYRHQYFQNRNQIQGVQSPIWVTVPVRKEQHRYGPIRQVRIDESRAWRKAYWGSIVYQYHKHPYFDHYADELEEILLAPWEHLVELNLELIAYFRSLLGIDTPVLRCSELGLSSTRSDMIHDVCLEVGATCYLSGPSGRDYLDETLFGASGIEVAYHSFEHPSYLQAGKPGFTSHLSVLDLLMNHGPASRSILLPPSQAEAPLLRLSA